ncbi:hypothetical protein PABG_12157 [Paracoccidioides brasiliensis Pb03]|nr:hypothetical protein PABG_12157 [Paracoccidioides brasiliensis Pb03]
MRGNASSPVVGSSPHSSNEAASRPGSGSSETKMTAFSPEDLRLKSRFDSGMPFATSLAGDDRRPFYSIHGLGNHHGQDPFQSTSIAGGRMQLSATASSFTPSGFSINPFAGFSASASRTPLSQADQRMSSMGYLAATSEPDARDGAGDVIMHATGTPKHVKSGFDPNGKGMLVKTPLPMFFAHLGKFDGENRNRAFSIAGIPTNFPYLTLAEIFNRHEFTTLKGPVLNELASTGCIYVGFTDVRDAKKASTKVSRLHPEWRVSSMTAQEYAQKFDPNNAYLISNFEGHVYATITYDSSNQAMDARIVSHSFKDLLETFGDIKAFQNLPCRQVNVEEYLLEFFDTRAADNVVSTLNKNSLDDCFLELKHHKPDMPPHTPRQVRSFESPKDLYPSSDLAYRRRPYSSRRFSSTSPSPYHEISPTGRSMVPVDDRASALGWMTKTGDGFNSIRSRHEIGRHGHHGGGDPRSNNQNYVDIERIRCGVDVRTTIMLRNIPNKIDQAMLKDIVDETSHGKYDFMYLRIDFANNCKSFAKARAGHSWNCFNSDKIAEISYATIQGKDCLVQKFRNSSVMLEHPSFRPKIFHTGTGPVAGTEDRFPGPDNPSKMRRSVENAEHVGLFAPRVGQQYRDEQRRRRSQFDRGTIAAEREFYYPRPVYTPRRLHGHGHGDMLPIAMSPCYENVGNANVGTIGCGNGNRNSVGPTSG